MPRDAALIFLRQRDGVVINGGLELEAAQLQPPEA
jgi:hypothetical protein